MNSSFKFYQDAFPNIRRNLRSNSPGDNTQRQTIPADLRQGSGSSGGQNTARGGCHTCQRDKKVIFNRYYFFKIFDFLWVMMFILLIISIDDEQNYPSVN